MAMPPADVLDSQRPQPTQRGAHHGGRRGVRGNPRVLERAGGAALFVRAGPAHPPARGIEEDHAHARADSGGLSRLIASWFGWPGSRDFLFDTALAGGAFSFGLILARGQLVRPFLPLQTGWVGRLITPGEPAPYGVAIALGALIAFPSSEWLRLVHTSY